MRPLFLILVALALAGCSGDKQSRPQPGDSAPAGDPGGQTGDTEGQGDAGPAVTPPRHAQVTSGSGEASSTNYKARVRIGGPMPPGTASGSGRRLQASTPESL
jgi:hypothetical protein